MVVRYNSTIPKRNYKRKPKNISLVSNKKSVGPVTPENKLFLQSLGFEILV